MTNVYDRWVLPRLINLVMQNKMDTAERAKFVPRSSGVVLEIGAGSGLNIPFYSHRVERLFALDPSVELWKMADKRARRAGFPVEFLPTSAEHIPLADNAVDTVVSTWTLCTIPDPRRALTEMKRVLRPGGTLIFVEHGRSPDERILAWQTRLNPIWKRLAGGCNLNRRIDELLKDAGFRITEIERGYNGSPRLLTFTYRGLAERPNGVAM
jgi:ubiquinone/menaquinone biosynthesis C-methylase UbiE